MVTPRQENPSSLDDFGTDEPFTAAEVKKSTGLDAAPPPKRQDDGWDDDHIPTPEVAAAPDPIDHDGDEEDGLPRHLQEQPIEDGVTQYEVIRGFTVEGKSYRQGDIIKVQCRFCALWQREWMDKVRCYPGRTLSNGTIMMADRFSCEQYFICKEMEPEFKTFLSLSSTAVVMVKQMVPAVRHLLELERWAHTRIKQDEDADPAAIFRSAKDFLSTFSSLPQIVLFENFIRDYSKLQQAELKARTKKKRSGRPPLPYGQGDLVSWQEPEFSSVVKGVILKRSRGAIVVSCIEGPEHLLGQKLKYDYTEWHRDKSPTLIRKSVAAMVKENS